MPRFNAALHELRSPAPIEAANSSIRTTKLCQGYCRHFAALPCATAMTRDSWSGGGAGWPIRRPELSFQTGDSSIAQRRPAWSRCRTLVHFGNGRGPTLAILSTPRSVGRNVSRRSGAWGHPPCSSPCKPGFQPAERRSQVSLLWIDSQTTRRNWRPRPLGLGTCLPLCGLLPRRREWVIVDPVR
jgi:hypothetical protein